MGDNNLKYARKAELTKINARIEFDKYIDHAIKLLKDYQDITHLYIEKILSMVPMQMPLKIK